MGPVPAYFNLDAFVGEQMNQIGIGPYDLQFIFGSRIVACTGRVVVEVDGQSTLVYQGKEPFWMDVTPLPRIVGRDAISWRLEGTHEFSITLTDGGRLRFQSSDCPYEEFVIHPEIQVL